MGKVKLEVGMEFRYYDSPEVWRVINIGLGRWGHARVLSVMSNYSFSCTGEESNIEVLNDFELWVSRIRKERGCKDDD